MVDHSSEVTVEVTSEVPADATEAAFWWAPKVSEASTGSLLAVAVTVVPEPVAVDFSPFNHVIVVKSVIVEV